MGVVSPPHFVYDFSRKIFIIFYFIIRSNILARLSLLLEILRAIIVIICFPVYDVTNFEIKLSFLFKPLDEKIRRTN